MNNRNIILIIILVVVIIFAILGVVLGVTYYRNSKVNDSSGKQVETFNLTLDDMYCNIKDSKKIMKVKITIETSNKKTLDMLGEKQFLIRDDINKIIRNKTEDEIQGEEGQVGLQKEIKESLVKLFNNSTITNIYFNDLIIQ
ncbi:flagellar basal body-associated FliL family protein [Schnuerera ultunensis]|uniref:Flagellar protein FliL n=1 Tax=[Clostridium] ultunense Esp TaxID=1288971 RepID=A0A1M4PNF3_9FIRM|nr:flagellar basal body-associated FliL family protein [Schnuerera ultunensis]SHD77023.1 putative Flagellar basal body-associated protein FliL [[Clostridium] ultunense Esp]